MNSLTNITNPNSPYLRSLPDKRSNKRNCEKSDSKTQRATVNVRYLHVSRVCGLAVALPRG